MSAEGRSDVTWKDLVRDALIALGGQGHLDDINARIEGHPKTTTNPTWKATIRRVVRQYAIFEPVPPDRSGIYRYVGEKPLTLGPEGEIINHSTAQGMLLSLGRIYKYEVFAPAADRHETFQGQPLSMLTTVSAKPEDMPWLNVKRIQQVDCIWMSEDVDGLYPVYGFEVEHTTRIEKGLRRLLGIPERFRAKLFVIAPSDKERSLFEKLIGQMPYRPYRDRFHFHLYEELQTLFNAAVRHEEVRARFGVNYRFQEAPR